MLNVDSIKIIIVPHASSRYSGDCAIKAFETIKNKTISNVIVLSTDHNLRQMNETVFHSEPVFHSEHSYYNIKQYIDKYTNNIKRDIYYVNENTIENIQEIKNKIENNTLIIANTDLSHKNGRFKETVSSLKELMQIDSNTIKNIITNEKLNKNDLCGYYVIKLLHKLFDFKIFYPRIMSYYNSQQYYPFEDIIDITKTSVVSYVSIVLTTEVYYSNNNNRFLTKILTDFEQQLLIKMARTSILNKLDNNIDVWNLYCPALEQEFDVFITLWKNKILRGCTGSLNNSKRINENVIEYSINSAFHDKRFNLVELNEMKNIKIDITILDKMKPITLNDYLNKNIYMEGRDGIYMENVAFYLPSVIIEQKWTKEEQLKNLCNKGGYNNNCYLKSKTDLFYNEGFEIKEKNNYMIKVKID